MDKTIIIVGDSPFLANVENKMHYILEKYNSIGINNSILRYNVGLHIFQDEKFVKLTNKYKNIKTIQQITK